MCYELTYRSRCFSWAQVHGEHHENGARWCHTCADQFKRGLIREGMKRDQDPSTISYFLFPMHWKWKPVRPAANTLASFESLWVFSWKGRNEQSNLSRLSVQRSWYLGSSPKPSRERLHNSWSRQTQGLLKRAFAQRQETDSGRIGKDVGPSEKCFRISRRTPRSWSKVIFGPRRNWGWCRILFPSIATLLQNIKRPQKPTFVLLDWFR